MNMYQHSDELSIIENEGDRILNYVPINDSRNFLLEDRKCEKNLFIY